MKKALIDLRQQATKELKEKWYYQDIKWGLKINKNSVVFDKEFKFKLRDSEAVLDSEEDEIAIDFYISGDYDKTLGHYNKKNRYNDGSEDEILKEILLYIANYI